MHEILKEGSFFKGRIIRMVPSLDACLVDYGAENSGFLPFFCIEGFDKTLHKEGYILSVCIEKPERGNKGAALSAPLKIPEGSVVHELSLDKPIYQKPPKNNKWLISNITWILAVFLLIAIGSLNT